MVNGVERSADRDAGQNRCDLCGVDGLYQGDRGTHHVVGDEGFGDGLGQFVKLGGSQDSPRNTHIRASAHLSHLAPNVAGLGSHQMCADDRQDDVVADVGPGCGGGQIGRGLLEERFGRVFWRRRVDHVDDDVRAGQCAVEAVTGE